MSYFDYFSSVVRLSIIVFKCFLLWKHLSNFDQISGGASMPRGSKSLNDCDWLSIWSLLLKTVKNLKKIFLRTIDHWTRDFNETLQWPFHIQICSHHGSRTTLTHVLEVTKNTQMSKSKWASCFLLKMNIWAFSKGKMPSKKRYTNILQTNLLFSCWQITVYPVSSTGEKLRALFMERKHCRKISRCKHGNS